MPLTITVLPDGPLRIAGRFDLVDPEGNRYALPPGPWVELCRCGQSANRPFCDGRHLLSGFRDPAVARDLPPPKVVTTGASGTAPARVTVNHNGAYRVEGDFRIVDATGREYGLGKRPSLSLCRCGASRNKPFCDGTHNTIRFIDPAIAR